ncbi:hypothetical protein Leryth_024133 [Lithospermum erythrorhizon]|nr:hypothetical protein Leryth_024133 [Lithospermum erythrorhizon]
MLAIFKNDLVVPPKELNSPASVESKQPEETLKEFLSSHANNAFSIGFVDKALIAYAPSERSFLAPQRFFCGVNDIYCIFIGGLHNLCTLNKQYGLSKVGNEAMFVIEAYRTLRDRGPYPAHQVLQDLDGSFGFVLYDHKDGTVFAALGGDENVKLFWGIGSDDSVVISDDVTLIKSSCAKSFAPFPTGCMFHNKEGLVSFEHPTNKLKAMPRVDSEGAMCGASFKVDVYSKVHSMPRVGSSADWSKWG